MIKKISLLKVLGSILIIGIGARFTLNIGDIPITGQTLFVSICAVFMRPLESFVALILYLILGGMGVPLFADGASGFDKFSGGSGGFLVGFLFAAVIMSVLIKKYGRSAANLLTTMIIGTFIILVFGVLWLSYLYTFKKGLEYGFYPFWPGAVIKILIGTFVCFTIVKIQAIGKKNRS